MSHPTNKLKPFKSSITYVYIMNVQFQYDIYGYMVYLRILEILDECEIKDKIVICYSSISFHMNLVICLRWQGCHFNFFLGGHRTIEKLEKQHFICCNLTLFIVPFFFLSFFFIFSFFFLFFFFLGGRRLPSPLK